MPPRVLRFGAIVAHVNDVAAMDLAMASISRAAASQGGGGENFSDALAAHEEAKRSAFRTLNVSSIAAATSALCLRGRKDLAKRLRLGARSRGALVHPGETLAAEIAALTDEVRTSDEDLPAPQVASLSSASAIPPQFDPQEFRDDRQLRSRPKVFDVRDLADYRLLRRRPHRGIVLGDAGELLAEPLRAGLGGSEPHCQCGTRTELDDLRRSFAESAARQEAAWTAQQLDNDELRRKYAYLTEYCEGRFGYFDALVSDSIHEFRVDRGDVNRRVDAVQDFIDQFELAEDAPEDITSIGDGDASFDILMDRMTALEGQMLELRERYERLDRRFEVVYSGMEAAMHRQSVADKSLKDQIAEVRSMGMKIVAHLDARNLDSVMETVTALQVRSDRIDDAHADLLSAQVSGVARLLAFQDSLSALAVVENLRGCKEAKEGQEATSPPKEARSPQPADPAAFQDGPSACSESRSYSEVCLRNVRTSGVSDDATMPFGL